jgi:hypothetical protein
VHVRPCPATISWTTPSVSANTSTSIFMASTVRSTSPFSTCSSSATERDATMPGTGAATCPGSLSSALRRASVGSVLWSRTLTSRG